MEDSDKSLNKIDEGDNMMAVKKETTNTRNTYKPASNKDVVAAIVQSNQKHQKMFKALAK